MSTAFRSTIALLIGIVIFLGLPLIGWGMLDAQSFVSNPARLGYMILVVLLQILIVVMFPGVERTGGEGVKIVSRQRLAVILLQVASLAIVLAAPFSDHRDILVLDFELGRYLGLVLFAFGLLAMNWAHASLGKEFSVQVTIQEGHKLITGGIYRYLRHPRYLGIIILNVGISLVFRSGLALILTAALTVVLLWRIHDEEALMSHEFGADWDAYARKSRKLIPFVY